MTIFNRALLLLVCAGMLTVATALHAEEIQDRSIAVGDQTFRYLSAGSGERPIVLLHGWPQSADEFRRIMPELAEDFSVVAPDLSGVGGTTAPRANWRKDALASDIRAFVVAMGLHDPLLVGHDIGGMVAYAYARQFPEDLRGIVILDVPIPGLAPWDGIATSQHAWHFDFHGQEGLAETLVAGQQAEYFRYFIDRSAADPGAIADDEVATYARAYATKEQLRAGFELYRAFDEDVEFFRSQNGPFDTPMLVVGGEFSMQATLSVMADTFAAHGATDVTTVAIEGAGHWLAEEQPAATAATIATFADDVFSRGQTR